jgi:hypothetical protein
MAVGKSYQDSRIGVMLQSSNPDNFCVLPRGRLYFNSGGIFVELRAGAYASARSSTELEYTAPFEHGGSQRNHRLCGMFQYLVAEKTF